MAVTATTAQNMYIGAGDLFYKDNTGVWQPVGATIGPNQLSVVRTYYAPNLNGVVGPIIGTQYIADEMAELQCSPAEISSALMALMVADSVSSGGATPGAVAGSDTTLAAATVAGQSLAIKLTAVTGFSVGDYIKIGVTGVIEYRKLTRVGTLGVGGTGVDIDFPLISPHAVLEAATEVDGDGTTLITASVNRRLPTTAYHDWYLEVPGLNGRNARFFVKAGVVTSNAVFGADDSKEMAPQIQITGHRDPANPSVPAWSMQKVPAFA